MAEFDRKSIVQAADTIVVKIGSSVLTQDNLRIDLNRMQHFAAQFNELRQAGKRIIVVSSGAIAAGVGRLNLGQRPVDLPHLQAAAAAGQAWLIGLYEDSLRGYGLHAAQLLLTANDFRQRPRYLNVINTIRTLFEYDVVPIVNENDSVSVDEIKFGDNDHLAAMLASMLPNAMLIILSTVDGLHDGSTSGPLIPQVDGWNDDLLRMATTESSRMGTGGMESKLQAVRTAMTAGVNVVIANGTAAGVLSEVLAGDEIGTWFRTQQDALPAWKRWIGYTVAPSGKLVLDSGACEALLAKGRSLLVVGVREVIGDFGKGETVALVDPDGNEIARGLCNYSAQELRRIAGRKTGEIASVLGYANYPEAVHCDNLVVLGTANRSS